MEYRYDALGRRVYVRTRRDDSELCTSNCSSYIEHFVWDGNQLIYEKRQSTEVSYVHGLGIDRPLSVFYETGGVYPHTDVRGNYFGATDPDGKGYCTGGAPCPDIDWPGYIRYLRYERSDWVRDGTPAWRGSLIVGQADASDLMYMRNRYYDPNVGTFIQPDPIGVAGGSNLYGYANGDPINFWDPFGLCPYCRDAEGTEYECSFEEWVQWKAEQFGEWIEEGLEGIGDWVGDRSACFASIGEFGARLGVDAGLVALYASGTANLVRGGLLVAEGAGISSGLILGHAVGRPTATGAMEILAGRSLIGTGATEIGVATSGVPDGISLIPGGNTYNFSGFDCN